MRHGRPAIVRLRAAAQILYHMQVFCSRPAFSLCVRSEKKAAQPPARKCPENIERSAVYAALPSTARMFTLLRRRRRREEDHDALCFPSRSRLVRRRILSGLASVSPCRAVTPIRLSAPPKEVERRGLWSLYQSPSTANARTGDPSSPLSLSGTAKKSTISLLIWFTFARLSTIKISFCSKSVWIS